MECRKVSLRFKRTLNKAEQEELIAYFKGFILKMKTALKQKSDSIGTFGSIAKRFGSTQIDLIQRHIEVLLAPMEKNGIKTCKFEQYFSLDFEESDPLIYSFTYPHPQVIFGMAGIAAKMRKHGINVDAQDKMVFKNLVKEAKLERNLESIGVEVVQRELPK